MRSMFLFLVLLLNLSVHAAERAATATDTTKKMTLAEASRLLGNSEKYFVTDDFHRNMVDRLARPLRAYPRKVVETALLTLYSGHDTVSVQLLATAIELAQAYDTPELRQALLDLAESGQAAPWASGNAAETLGILGEPRIIPIAIRRFRSTRDHRLRSSVLHCLDSFKEYAIPALEALAKVEPNREQRMNLLHRLVLLDDAWAVEEFGKPEYAEPRFRRRCYWEREVRLKMLKDASKGQSSAETRDPSQVPMPPDYRAPYER